MFYPVHYFCYDMEILNFPRLPLNFQSSHKVCWAGLENHKKIVNRVVELILT